MLTPDEFEAFANANCYRHQEWRIDLFAFARAIEQAARREAVERAARIRDEWQRTYVLEHCCDLAQHNALKSVADAIRALMGEEGK